MKKRLTILFGLALVYGASAQTIRVQSFLNGQSLSCSNIAQPTNLASIGVITTNAVSLQFTNFQGTRLIADGTNYETRNPFKDVSLVSDRDGRYAALTWANTNTLQNWQQSPFSLAIKVLGQSGANSGVTFSFYPLVAGSNEINAASTRWDVGVTANTTTPVTLLTNVPMYLWMGADSLRCVRAVNADTDASSRVDVLELDLTGPVP